MIAHADPTLHSLCVEQMAPWLGRPVGRRDAEEVYQALNAANRSVFLLRIADGTVTLLEKPGFRLREDFHSSSGPEPEGLVIFREEFARALMYRDLFRRLLAASGLSMDMLIAIDVNDTPIDHADAPVFAFQKPRGANTVLIPDVDFLHGNFYIPPQYHDPIAYTDKSPRAVFAGSTTGGRTITVEDVRYLSLPRLRAGVFFKGSRQVDFRLPRIVQCESDVVAEMIAALGVNATPMDWQEQFRYRLILSMDGNGATCSRVVIGLLSQSVLVKYHSSELLYYFGAMVPWRHYIPVVADEDVEPLADAERRYPGVFASIAAEGQAFARRYLGREGIAAYGVALLQLCRAAVADAPQPKKDHDAPQPSLPTPLLELGAHIQGVGDVWGWPGEWVGEAGSGRAVEAIALIPAGFLQDALEVSLIGSAGAPVQAHSQAGFYGSRGKDRPLLGFAVRLRGEAATALRCRYRARFVDGAEVGPIADGAMCRAESGAAIESFEILVEESPSFSEQKEAKKLPQ